MLNEDQEQAVQAIVRFIDEVSQGYLEDGFFLLVGPAGTGKTFCMRNLPHRIKGRLLYTAPTNKATKVLRDTLTDDNYKPECCTIYSALGLRLEANGEIKELSCPEDPVDLSKFLAVVVDEASMVNAQLMRHIQHSWEEHGVPFVFMGDPYQLPPVKEAASASMEIQNRAALSKVMRHDNAILELATRIRSKVTMPFGNLSLEASYDPKLGGVKKVSAAAFNTMIWEAAEAGDFSKSNHAKVVAWRNATVDRYNAHIRKAIFANETEGLKLWYPTDRIIMLAPAKNTDGDSIASTDDEGVVMRVAVKPHPLYPEFQCFALGVTFDDNRTETVWALHPVSFPQFTERTERLASEARINGRKWKDFWAFKDAFHQVRHGYAITAHRAQGSTYQNVYVDYKDILCNQNRSEAMRCLYVAVTRAKHTLILA